MKLSDWNYRRWMVILAALSLLIALIRLFLGL